MKAHEIFQHASPELIRDMFHYLRTEQKEVYQTALSTLAQGRKLRPIFVQRKRPEEQYAWLQKTTKLRGSDGVCEHLLQLWLLKAHQALLVKFLDGIGIEHDGEGAADDLPDEIDAKKLKKTVEDLRKDYSNEVISVYLYTFQLQKSEGWDAINELLAGDSTLQLGAVEEEVEAEKVEEAPPAPKVEEPAPVEETAEEAPVEEEEAAVVDESEDEAAPSPEEEKE